MMSLVFRKVIMAVVIAALILAAAPVTGVFAAGEFDQPQPPADGEVSHDRLERIWARELKAYERFGKLFEKSDAMIGKVQGLIERAEENGKDVSAVQAALDAFEAALKDAHPLYESAKGIINSHKGFDEEGKVTDAALAKETVQEMGAKLKEIKSAMGGIGRALREAIRAFREANKPAETPTERDS